MTHPEHNGHASHMESEATETGAAHDDHAEAQSGAFEPGARNNEAITIAATVGVVAVGAALFEVALLPGIALGVCATLAPKYVPKAGAALAPMFRSSVRGVYKLGQKSREMMAEAKEQVHDIMAEVHAEGDAPKAAAAKTAADAPHA